MKPVISIPEKRKARQMAEPSQARAMREAAHPLLDDPKPRPDSRPIVQADTRKRTRKTHVKKNAKRGKPVDIQEEVLSTPRRSCKADKMLSSSFEIKDPAFIEVLARHYASEALHELAEIARFCDSDATRVSAIREILNRALGRPMPRRPDPNLTSETLPILKIVPYCDGTRD